MGQHEGGPVNNESPPIHVGDGNASVGSSGRNVANGVFRSRWLDKERVGFSKRKALQGDRKGGFQASGRDLEIWTHAGGPNGTQVQRRLR